MLNLCRENVLVMGERVNGEICRRADELLRLGVGEHAGMDMRQLRVGMRSDALKSGIAAKPTLVGQIDGGGLGDSRGCSIAGEG